MDASFWVLCGFGQGESTVVDIELILWLRWRSVVRVRVFGRMNMHRIYCWEYVLNPHIRRAYGVGVWGVSVFQIYSTATHILYCKYVFVCYALYLYTLYICKSSQPQYLLHNK